MNCSIKMQISLLTMGVSGISITGKIKPVIFPILWFSESGYLDGPVYNTYYNTLIVLPMVLDYLQYIFIALGLCFILVAAVLPFVNQKREEILQDTGEITQADQCSDDAKLLEDPDYDFPQT
ncbi:scavenger receptor class B member 1-like isoform X2 [Dendrobates tinctorius]|uniref:scavenger receptor class B member 1-like isoform X2 n=1 Tax=Dendrobates tinctorius TaxID=92724 RepID=UPI003CC9626D